MNLKRALLVLLALLSAMASWADGMVVGRKGAMPDRYVERPVTIPSQRAVIKWEDGVQTMLVESVVSGPRGVYGWVVPLPNEPLFVKAVNPTYLSNSFAMAQPQIRSDSSPPFAGILAFVIFAGAVLLTSGYRRKDYELGGRVVGFALEAGALALLGFLLYPALVGGSPGAEGFAGPLESGDAATESKSPVQVRSLGTIGSYDVDVVSARTAEPLLKWMRERNFQVPNRALPAIDGYVRDGWVFLAAKLRKDRDEPWPAHPLKAVFPSKEPVYPMRLTGTQDEPLRLELLVIGDDGADIDGMEVWKRFDHGITIPVATRDELEKEVYADWKNGLYAMAKSGQAVTYLRADLRPEQMKQDFAIRWTPYQGYTAEVWPTHLAVARMAYLGVIWLPVGLLVFGIVGVLWPQRVGVWAVGGPLVALSIAGSVVWAWRSQVKFIEADNIGSPARAWPDLNH